MWQNCDCYETFINKKDKYYNNKCTKSTALIKGHSSQIHQIHVKSNILKSLKFHKLIVSLRKENYKNFSSIAQAVQILWPFLGFFLLNLRAKYNLDHIHGTLKSLKTSIKILALEECEHFQIHFQENQISNLSLIQKWIFQGVKNVKNCFLTLSFHFWVNLGV